MTFLFQCWRCLQWREPRVGVNNHQCDPQFSRSGELYTCRYAHQSLCYYVISKIVRLVRWSFLNNDFFSNLGQALRCEWWEQAVHRGSLEAVLPEQSGDPLSKPSQLCGVGGSPPLRPKANATLQRRRRGRPTTQVNIKFRFWVGSTL